MSPPLLLLLVIGVVLAPGGCQHHDGLFYPFGLQEDDKLPYGADVSSPEIRLRVPVKFFDDIYDSLYPVHILVARELCPLTMPVLSSHSKMFSPSEPEFDPDRNL
ncbi:hypothetical protein AAG570_014154 [Ranatra chinensis]|uniref:Uncharacterized protein n=1 Tax=Ranatra chinensis TaxID=642074 RepID=A0ABD0XTX7_9HEMI